MWDKYKYIIEITGPKKDRGMCTGFNNTLYLKIISNLYKKEGCEVKLIKGDAVE